MGISELNRPTSQMNGGRSCTARTKAISSWPWPFNGLMSVGVERVSVAKDARHELAVDGLDLPACTELENVDRDAVGIAQSALWLLVGERNRVVSPLRSASMQARRASRRASTRLTGGCSDAVVNVPS
jgi:hypothetical protein